MMSELKFAHPHYFWALAILPVLAVFFFRAERARQVAINRLLAARLRPRLAGSASTSRRRAAFALLLAGLALCLAALAGPRWGVIYEETYSKGRDIIIAVDTSRSMLAQDLTPSRLIRARFAALDLLKELPGDRVGLVAFAGEAFLQAPLTPDHDAITESINALNTEVIGQGGTNLAAAIETVADAFGKGEGAHRALVLFSDGEELQEDALKAAEKYKDRFRIFTVGVGTEKGGPVIRPLRQGSEYVRDENGNLVTTKLEETRLREVAKLSGGFYVRLENGPADMRNVVQNGIAGMSEQEIESKNREVPQERYQWPLLAGLACLATSILLGERRRVVRVGAAAAALVLALLPPAQAVTVGKKEVAPVSTEPTPAAEPTPAPAPSEPSAEWQALEQQRASRPGVPELEYNVGCAAFRSGDYDAATKAFSNALGSGDTPLKSKAAYNLGNALARRGVKAEKEAKLADWENAVQQYNHALTLTPGDEAARVNRDLVQKAIDDLKKKEEEEKKKQEQEKKDQKDQKDQKQQQSKDGQDQKGKDSQGKDQKDGEPKPGEQKDGEQKDSKGQQQDAKEGDQKKDQEGGKPAEQQDAKAEKPETQEGKQGMAEDKKDGKIQQVGQPQDPSKDQNEKEAAEAAQAAREGRMTDKDAKSLLQGMRKYDTVLPPLRQVYDRRPRAAPAGKDW